MSGAATDLHDWLEANGHLDGWEHFVGRLPPAQDPKTAKTVAFFDHRGDSDLKTGLDQPTVVLYTRGPVDQYPVTEAMAKALDKAIADNLTSPWEINGNKYRWVIPEHTPFPGPFGESPERHTTFTQTFTVGLSR